MKDVMGLIFTGENDIHLGELTSLRAVAALPIAGRYRVIDFQLSSMVHSGHQECRRHHPEELFLSDGSYQLRP